MSTTSVAAVYAVMLEHHFNKTNYGKTILAGGDRYQVTKKQEGRSRW